MKNKKELLISWLPLILMCLLSLIGFSIMFLFHITDYLVGACLTFFGPLGIVGMSSGFIFKWATRK